MKLVYDVIDGGKHVLIFTHNDTRLIFHRKKPFGHIHGVVKPLDPGEQVSWIWLRKNELNEIIKSLCKAKEPIWIDLEALPGLVMIGQVHDETIFSTESDRIKELEKINEQLGEENRIGFKKYQDVKATLMQVMSVPETYGLGCDLIAKRVVASLTYNKFQRGMAEDELDQIKANLGAVVCESVTAIRVVNQAVEDIENLKKENQALNHQVNVMQMNNLDKRSDQKTLQRHHKNNSKNKKILGDAMGIEDTCGMDVAQLAQQAAERIGEIDKLFENADQLNDARTMRELLIKAHDNLAHKELRIEIFEFLYSREKDYYISVEKARQMSQTQNLLLSAFHCLPDSTLKCEVAGFLWPEDISKDTGLKAWNIKYRVGDNSLEIWLNMHKGLRADVLEKYGLTLKDFELSDRTNQLMVTCPAPGDECHGCLIKRDCTRLHDHLYNDNNPEPMIKALEDTLKPKGLNDTLKPKGLNDTLKPKGLNDWKKKYYAIDASDVSKADSLQHSLTKWKGLRPDVLKEYNLTKKYISIFSDENKIFPVGISSCALCQLHHENSCIGCPLGDCQSEYGAWQDSDDPEPMIRRLKDALL